MVQFSQTMALPQQSHLNIQMQSNNNGISRVKVPSFSDFLSGSTLDRTYSFPQPPPSGINFQGFTVNYTINPYVNRPAPHYLYQEQFVPAFHIPFTMPSRPAVNKVASSNRLSTKSDSEVDVGEKNKCTCPNSTVDGVHIPRPRNAFIFFRQEHHRLLFEKKGDSFKNNSEVSREIGQRWRALSTEEKQYWIDLAEEEKIKHAQKYPNYKYIPRKTGKKSGCLFCRNKRRRRAPSRSKSLSLLSEPSSDIPKSLESILN